MALSASPRKVVPLSTGDDWQSSSRPYSAGPTLTRRVFFCGVVVESCGGNSMEYSQDVQALVASLGETMSSKTEGILTPRSTGERIGSVHSGTRKRASTSTNGLMDVVSELVSTERSYVMRLRILKHDYADPLRNFARSKETAIIPLYEAKTLFGNIDNLLPVNEAFLADLERMLGRNGPQTVGGVGDVALRHFRDSKGFEHYRQYYAKRAEAQAIYEAETKKKSSGFTAYVDRIKYSSDMKSRVGLRELLMDPVQRIPRYTLLFRQMIKHMAPGDPQRAKLLEADEIASKIALAEQDELEKRAAIMCCLSATIDGFPVKLISSSRRFIDCIDVEDTLVDPASLSGLGGPSSGSLHCTLFLFDDKLMIVRRSDGERGGGRALASLDDLDKVTKNAGLTGSKKKSGMSCKGVVDVTEVVATDVGGSDMHMYIQIAPQDQTDRLWMRSFRALTVVNPPSPVNLNPTQTQADKKRFLENLWNVQGRFRTKSGQSVLLRGDEIEVESKGDRITRARTYFNVYQRTAFLQESKKTKIVLHVDALGTADPIPFGVGAPPHVVVRVQPMAGDLTRYTVTSNDPNDESEEDIVQTAKVCSRIVHTIHQYGLFKFRTGRNSLPSTPTASTRSRVAIFGLDAISRNLFNVRPGSTMGDFFGGSTNSNRRTKSSVSRSIATTATVSSADSSLMKASHRSNSTATSATSVSSGDDDTFILHSSVSQPKKLIKRGKSPGGCVSEPERTTSNLSRSRSRSEERELEYSDPEEFDSPTPRRVINSDQSDWDLNMRLELARQNSQHATQVDPAYDGVVEDSIYEEDPPQPFGRSTRESKDSESRRSTTPRPESPSPLRSPRSPSLLSPDRRPLGPRSPSPSHLSPPSSPSWDVEATELESTLEATLVNTPQTLVTPLRLNGRVSPLPRSKRMPFESMINTEITPRAGVDVGQKLAAVVEPLSIKKKTSVRTIPESPTAQRRAKIMASPLSKSTTSNAVSDFPRHSSPRTRKGRPGAHHDKTERLLQMAETTKEDFESSRRAVKRIKIEVEKLRTVGGESGDKRPYAERQATITREAQERMEEMRQLIAKRIGEGNARHRARSLVDGQSSRPSDNNSRLNELATAIEELASEAEANLAEAASNQESFCEQFSHLKLDLQKDSLELEQARVERQSTKRQSELMVSLLAEVTAEKDIMYETFNEELDEMFNDANLPRDEAFVALTQTLRQTKDARNQLEKENSQLKWRLTQMEAQKEEWGALLRAHGLIP